VSATIKPSPKLTWVVNDMVGKETPNSDDTRNVFDTTITFVPTHYEYVDDTDGGFMTFGTKVQSVTITSDHLIAGGLRLRLEYQGNFADEPIFPKDDGSTKKSQSTLTVGLVYGFSGKI